MDEFEREEKGALWDWFVKRAHGPHALFWLVLVSFCEPIFLPIVPESVMAAMILAGRERWKRYVAITTVASVLGGIAGYGVGLFLFHQFGEPVLASYGLHHWFRVVARLLQGNVFLLMFLLMFSPLPDKAFVILAGFFHVSFPEYAAGFFLGRLMRFGIVGFLVQRFGEHVLGVVREYFEWFAVAVIAVLFYAALHFFHVLPF
jgi:membrane protein YqaA with SNARE-associated domain